MQEHNILFYKGSRILVREKSIPLSGMVSLDIQMVWDGRLLFIPGFMSDSKFMFPLKLSGTQLILSSLRVEVFRYPLRRISFRRRVGAMITIWSSLFFWFRCVVCHGKVVILPVYTLIIQGGIIICRSWRML